MFNKAISRKGIPKYLSSDNNPLFQYHRWKANLRIQDVEEIKSVPYVPVATKNIVRSLYEYYRPPRPVYAARGMLQLFVSPDLIMVD